MKNLSKQHKRLYVWVLAILLLLFVLNVVSLTKNCKNSKTTVETQCKQFYYTILLIGLFIILHLVFTKLRGMKHYNMIYLLAIVGITVLSIYLAKVKDVFQCKKQKDLQKYCKLNLYINYGFIALLFVSLCRGLIR